MAPACPLSAELSPVSSYTIAPDGRSFVVGDGAVLVRQGADGRGRRVLTEEGALEVDPTFAPSGAEIAFARIDAQTGLGLGIWAEPASGGDARQLELPPELGASPTPAAPSEPGTSPPAAPQPILRAPRYSPDGTALAFVDLSGRVGIVELPRDRLTSARFAAVDAPVWLPIRPACCCPARRAGRWSPPPRVSRCPPSTRAQWACRPSSSAACDWRAWIAAAPRCAWSTRLAGSARPQAGEVGRYLFVQVQPGAPQAAGRLMLSNASDQASELLAAGGPPVTAAGFGPQARLAVAARLDAGIWLVDVATGQGYPADAGGLAAELAAVAEPRCD